MSEPDEYGAATTGTVAYDASPPSPLAIADDVIEMILAKSASDAFMVFGDPILP